jgi:hypothetical protein
MGKIQAARVVGKAFLEARHGHARKVEAEKLKAEFVHRLAQFGNGETVFLDVEQQIPAGRETLEVR